MQIPVEALNLLMLNVGYAKHNGDWNWKNVYSPFTRIFCVTKGRAWLHLSESTIELKSGHLYIIPAYTMHNYECNEWFEHYYLHVYEAFKSETNMFEFYDFPTEVEATEVDRLLCQMMCQLHPEAQLPASDPTAYDNQTSFSGYVRRYNDMPLYDKMRLRGATLTLFSRFLEHATPKLWTTNERMQKVLQYISAHLYNDIDIDSLAQVACVTKPYLIRLFKQDFGISPLKYINKKKVERAQLLLITEDMPVKDIAYTLGFNDYSYFIRMFKKTTGKTPQVYRDTMR